jgi:hypothetical protein
VDLIIDVDVAGKSGNQRKPAQTPMPNLGKQNMRTGLAFGCDIRGMMFPRFALCFNKASI